MKFMNIMKIMKVLKVLAGPGLSGLSCLLVHSCTTLQPYACCGPELKNAGAKK